MKYHVATSSLSFAASLRSSPIPMLRLIFAAGYLGLIANAARAQENKLEVGVRPTVVDKSILWSNKLKTPGAGGHGKVYGLAKAEEIKSELRLVKPVNEGALITIVLNELDANGFREFKPGEKPEILLTVSYGRGEVHNPYIRDQGEVGGIAGTAPAPPGGDGSHASGFGGDYTTQMVTGAFVQQFADEKSNGYEAKLQKAGFEKLYIRITAWEYPSNSKAKPRMLWKTVMVVDDPDHRDLNTVAAEMLAAGAPFFDKEIKEPEAVIFRPLPNGRVNVGTPEVVEPKSK